MLPKSGWRREARAATCKEMAQEALAEVLDFLIVQAIILAVNCVGVGVLLSFLFPVDPARLPRVVAWFQFQAN